MMAELPADIQAALDAYLAARVDDATWEAYVNALVPGVALDVATYLCLWTQHDASAAAWIQHNFESHPDDWDDPAVPEPPEGLQVFRTLQDFIDAEPSCESYSMTLERDIGDTFALTQAEHTVRLEYDDWQSEGCYRADECRAEHTARMAYYQQHGEWQPYVDAWLVAACRAACLAWSPEWARRSPREAD